MPSVRAANPSGLAAGSIARGQGATSSGPEEPQLLMCLCLYQAIRGGSTNRDTSKSSIVDRLFPDKHLQTIHLWGTPMVHGNPRKSDNHPVGSCSQKIKMLGVAPPLELNDRPSADERRRDHAEWMEGLIVSQKKNDHESEVLKHKN